MEIKVGDIVRLRSGGPKMTVEGIGTYGMVSTGPQKAKCLWFDGVKRYDDLFVLATLEPVT